MASPFRLFRKNQKLMLAALALLAMIGFVILPVIMQGMSHQRITNARVVLTSHRDLRQSDLRGLLSDRQVTLRFLEALGQEIARRGVRPVLVQSVLDALVPADGVAPTSDEALVYTWLLAHRAEQLGLVVDDKTINAFITELTQGQVSTDDLEPILKSIKVTENRLFPVLERELLALRLREMFSYSLGGTTPAQRWDYFQRLNRKVAIESVPVKVSDFLERIPDPDESTLREFFDQHKTELDDPTSPEPGFREPKKVAVEYLKAEYEKFVELEPVSEDELRAYYEKNKDKLYRQEALPELEEKDASQEGEAPKTDSGAQAEQPSAEPEAPAEQKASPGETGAEPAEPEPTADEPAEAPAESEPPPAKSQPVEEAVPTPSTKSQPAEEAVPTPSGTDDTSFREAKSPFRLASLEQAEAAPEETPTTEAPPGEGPAADAPAPQPTAAASEEPPAEPADATADPGTATTDDPRGTAEPLPYVPLEKVKDEIRRVLAREKAETTVATLLGDLQSQLSGYRDDLIIYEDQKEAAGGDHAAPPPGRPDFQALAKKHGLVARQTGLISALEAEALDIADSATGQSEFLYSAFERLPEYRPAISQDRKGDSYLFWKVDDVDQRIPEFEEPGVRERVVRQWKMIQARQPAEEEAKRLATEAREAGKPLPEVFADRPQLVVTASEPFSWLTYGEIPAFLAQGPPDLSEVAGVEMAGHDFMGAVFSLGKGQVGTAVNQPKTIVYMVRVTDSNPSPEYLWRRFVAESYWTYFRAASNDQAMAQKAWLDAIKSEVGFRWDPDWQRQSMQRRRK